MASLTRVYVRVFLFAVACAICFSVMVYAIGSASRLFEKRGYLYANFETVDGIYIGAYASLAGMDIGSVESIRMLTPAEQRKDLASQKQRRELLRPLYLKRLRTIYLASIRKAQIAKFKKTEGRAPTEGELKALVDKQLESRLPRFLRKGEPIKKRYLRVRLLVSQKFFVWLGKDTLASLEGRGVLGRAVIDLSPSLLKSPTMAIKDGDELEGQATPMLVNVIGDIGKFVDKVIKTIDLMNYFLRELGDPKLWQDVKGIVHGIDVIFKQARTGPGLVHELLTSRRLARDVRALLEEVRLTVRSLANAGVEVSRVLRKVQQNDTLIQKALLSPEGRQLFDAAEDLMKISVTTIQTLHKLLKSPQRRGTFVHRILFDPKAAKMLRGFREASDDVVRIFQKIRRADGSLGAILYDPTAYNDLVTVLNNLKNSSLVRFLIDVNTTDRERK